MQSPLRFVLSVVQLVCLTTLCQANCDQCGCADECSGGKICKLVCEEKTISVVCYKCEGEEFCIPDPSCKGCKHCERACDVQGAICDCPGGCDKAGCAGAGCVDATTKKGKRFVWFNWKPSTAQMATKKKLYMRTVEKKVPSYKWIVVERCKCGACVTSFNGKDMGYVKNAPPGLEAGQSIAVGKKEFLQLAENSDKSIAEQSRGSSVTPTRPLSS